MNVSLTNENPDAATPGVVDDEDYQYWASQFGNGLESGAAAAASVPEPTTALLAAANLMALLFAACRRSRDPFTRD
jgi:hypothetical protein